jgi:hypothetical protein
MKRDSRLPALKKAPAAERPSPTKRPSKEGSSQPASKAKARIGKRAVVGYFSPELSRELNIMAKERDTTLQSILGEALDLWLREQGRRPFGER